MSASKLLVWILPQGFQGSASVLEKLYPKDPRISKLWLCLCYCWFDFAITMKWDTNRINCAPPKPFSYFVCSYNLPTLLFHSGYLWLYVTVLWYSFLFEHGNEDIWLKNIEDKRVFWCLITRQFLAEICLVEIDEYLHQDNSSEVQILSGSFCAQNLLSFKLQTADKEKSLLFSTKSILLY